MVLDISEILFLDDRDINFDLWPLHVDFVTPNCLNEKQPSKLHKLQGPNSPNHSSMGVSGEGLGTKPSQVISTQRYNQIFHPS